MGLWKPAIEVFVEGDEDEDAPIVAGVLTVWCEPDRFRLIPKGGARFDLHITFADPETKEIIARERRTSEGVNG